MKGLELPINILVIVAIAIIVLIALVAMFYPSFLSGTSTASLETAKNQACRSLVSGNNCDTTIVLSTIRVFDYDVDGGGTNGAGDNLLNLCALKYQIVADDVACRKMCGCSG